MDGTLGESRNGDQSNGSEKKTKSKLGFCALVPGGHGAEELSSMVFLMLGLPFVLGLLGRGKRKPIH
jgi:hypothetical protein